MVQGQTSRETGSDFIEVLLNDHRTVKGLFEQLVASQEASESAGLLEELKGLLTVHNATEENLIYPAVRFLASRPRDAETLYHQQDEAEAGLWELDGLLKGSLEGPDFAERARALQKAVLAHIRKEEETEFPHLRETLSAADLQTISSDVAAFRAKFGGAAMANGARKGEPAAV
jgi:hemerythrin superfamily protein